MYKSVVLMAKAYTQRAVIVLVDGKDRDIMLGDTHMHECKICGNIYSVDEYDECPQCTTHEC